MMTDKKRNALLVYTRYLKGHRPQLSVTNPFEQQNLHIKRRTRPVCIFPNDRSIERSVGGHMTETGEKWEDGEPYMLPDVIVAVLNGTAIGDFAVVVLGIAWRSPAPRPNRAGGHEHRRRTFGWHLARDA